MEMPDVIYASRSKYKTINTGNWSIHKVPTSAASQKPIRGKEKEEKDTYHHDRVVEALKAENESLKRENESLQGVIRVISLQLNRSNKAQDGAVI